MFKIGEFSKITQVSIRMLRYYDEQKLLMPCKVDPSTGYRLYSASQIDELGRIVMLRDMGFSIKEMQKLLQIQGLKNTKWQEKIDRFVMYHPVIQIIHKSMSPKCLFHSKFLIEHN